MPAHSRKLRISPMQREVMWILSDAGAESLITVFVTIAAAFPTYQHKELKCALPEAISGLYYLDLVMFTRDYGKPGMNYVRVQPDEIMGVLNIGEYISYDEHQNVWRLGEEAGSPYELGLALTKEGEAVLYR